MDLGELARRARLIASHRHPVRLLYTVCTSSSHGAHLPMPPCPACATAPASCRVPLLLASADELELVRSCRYACLLTYIAAYFALTLGARGLSSRPRYLPTPLHLISLRHAGNKLATGLWIYPVFNDAEVRDPRATTAAARAARTHCAP